MCIRFKITIKTDNLKLISYLFFDLPTHLFGDIECALVIEVTESNVEFPRTYRFYVILLNKYTFELI